MKTDRDRQTLDEAMHIADDAWQELQRSANIQLNSSQLGARLPDLSFAEAERRSGVGQSLLKRLDAFDTSAIPHDLALTLRLVRFRAECWAREAQCYWSIIDPRGIGQFNLFLPTAYCGGALLALVHRQFAEFSFREPTDLHRYLILVDDYARLMDQFAFRTAGQAERGVRMPRVQVLQARKLLSASKSSARETIEASLARLEQRSSTFIQEVETRIQSAIEPAFDRALAVLSDDYLKDAPDRVGLGQYAQGEDLYGQLVKVNTTLDLTPEQVQARGLERIAEIELAIKAVETELGYENDPAGFAAHLDTDMAWRARTTEEVTKFFYRYIDRIRPKLEKHFQMLPKAAYGVKPLPPALEGSMTYGYYDVPLGEGKTNCYVFNAANLTRQPLFNLAALTYHELMPGHHLQLATQQENETLHPFRQHSFVNAYVEGWAEYAATFAGEIGMYELPEERYGRLVMDAFLTTRLVVDTGMNVLGWSLERARDYMRTHSRLAEAEILTETVRYSCDMPGQALAYKLGDTRIIDLRDRTRQALGSQFALKDFHTLILEPGAIPISDLEWHVEHEIAARSSQVSGIS